MELIVISESKLKIMLSGADMAKYQLAGEGMDCADRRTREAFRHIFEDARAEIGFETEGARLFIQFYASKEGGGELFVTKLSEGSLPREALCELPFPETEAEAAPLAVEAALSEGEKALLRRVYACGEEAPRVRRVWLRIGRLSELLAVCRRLRDGGFRGESTVYIAEEGGWYLGLEISGVIGRRLPKRLSFLAEYGQPIEGEALGLYLAEHGRVICEGDAAEVLGRL